MDVPLIRPIARIVLPMGAFLCMFPRIATLDLRRLRRSQIGATDRPWQSYKSDFLNTLDERGFIHQCSDFAGLDALAAKGEAIGYIGFDCTAPSFHVGNMIVLMMLHWLQRRGNKPIVLMGGGTTRVGDPSGKDETRKILPIEQIEANKASMQRACAKLMAFGSRRTDAIMLDNAEWLTKLNYIEMLRDIGRHFSVNRMLALDSVKSRLERDQEMSFIEFNYQVLQAYDFTVLARTQGCNLQMGASDQWGNIVTGIDLGRRMGTHQLYALTTPLLTTSSGAKMGKSVAGAVWLNEDMLGAYDFWQYWRNAEDADVGPLPEAVHDAADGRDRQARGACRAPRSTRPRRCWRPRSPPCCTAATRRKRRPGRRRRPSSRARWRKGCRRSRSPRPSWRRGSAC